MNYYLNVSLIGSSTKNDRCQDVAHYTLYCTVIKIYVQIMKFILLKIYINIFISKNFLANYSKRRILLSVARNVIHGSDNRERVRLMLKIIVTVPRAVKNGAIHREWLTVNYGVESRDKRPSHARITVARTVNRIDFKIKLSLSRANTVLENGAFPHDDFSAYILTL